MKKLLTTIAYVLWVMAVEAAQQQVWMQCFWGADVPIAFETATNIDNEVVPGSAIVNVGDSAEFIAFPAGAQTVDHWRMSAGPSVYAGGDKISGSDGKTNLIWTATNVTTTYLGVKFRWVDYKLAYDLAGGSGTASGTNGIPYTNAITLASAPTRTGWRFVGWRNAAGSVLAAGASVTGATFTELDSVHEDGKTVILTAQWQEESYSVTSSSENCTVTVSKTFGVKYTDEVLISWNPNTPVGHTRTLQSAQVLSGTTVLKTFTSGTSGTFNMSEAGKGYYGSVTVRVVYRDAVDQHRVTVSSAGNGTVAKSPDQSAYDYGSTVTISATPYDGYAFAKWNDDVTDNPRTVTVGTTDVTYTATFTHRVYTLTFDANGGTFADGSSTLTRNVAFQSAIGDLPDPPPTYPRMSPKGWYTEKSGGSSIDRDTRYNWTYDRPIYMQWQESHLYRIKLTATPAEAGTVSGGGDFAEGETTTLVATPSEGYSFASWSDGGAQTHDVTVGAADVTYGATFTGNVYKVYFYLQDSDGNQYDGVSPKAEARTYGMAFGELPRPTLDDETLQFDHWTDEFGNEITAESIVTGGNPSKQRIDLYVSVSRRSFYTVTYRGEGGSGTMVDQKIYRGEETALTSNAFVRTGYTFQGWAETNNLTKVKYLDGTNVLDIAAADATNELHAVWQPIRYRVVFDANGGTGVMADQSFAYDEQKSLTTNGFSRGEFWSFDGWKDATSGVSYGEGQEVSNLCETDDGVVTLVAQWKSLLGELSEAMGCDNLVWTTNIVAKALVDGSGWHAGSALRGGQSIPCACSIGQNDMEIMEASKIAVSGELAFSWMTTGASGTLGVMILVDAKLVIDPKHMINLAGEPGVWHEERLAIDLEEGKTAYIQIAQQKPGIGHIANMTWTPEGAEPQQGDPVATTGVSATDGKFVLSMPGESGVNYGVWTNADLLVPVESWGFMTNRLGSGTPFSFELPILPELPQLFFSTFKVK